MAFNPTNSLDEAAEAFARQGAGNKEAGHYLNEAIQAEADEAISTEELLDVVCAIRDYLNTATLLEEAEERKAS